MLRKDVVSLDLCPVIGVLKEDEPLPIGWSCGETQKEERRNRRRRGGTEGAESMQRG
jgi:hypothetical protein